MSKQEYIERKVLVEENIAHGMCGHYWFRMNDEDSKKLCLSTNGPWCYKLSEAVNIPGFVGAFDDNNVLCAIDGKNCYHPSTVRFRVPVEKKEEETVDAYLGYTARSESKPAPPKCEDCANFILHFNIVKESYREPFEVFDLPVPCCLNLIGDKLHSTKYERTFGKCGVNGDCFVAKGKT